MSFLVKAEDMVSAGLAETASVEEGTPFNIYYCTLATGDLSRAISPVRVGLVDYE
jgi:hypothetical protein